MTGIPCAGKTTLIKTAFPNIKVISPDNYIPYTPEQPWSFKLAREAWKKAEAEFNNLLDKEDIIFDATLTSPKNRKRYINLGKKAGVKVVAIFCNIDISIALKRNADRNTFRKVPNFVIEDMSKRLVAPTIEEGFDKILVYDGIDLEGFIKRGV